jgi:copper homeostasis protein CutC
VCSAKPAHHVGFLFCDATQNLLAYLILRGLKRCRLVASAPADNARPATKVQQIARSYALSVSMIIRPRRGDKIWRKR